MFSDKFKAAWCGEHKPSTPHRHRKPHMTSAVSNLISRTGRVQSWVDNPESRLPVSCTVFVVQDRMEGPDGIEDSWRFTSYALRNGAGASIHLSNLRPRGSDNGRGLTASGPVSFAKIYSTLNEVLRRGGTFKNGAITLHLDYTHPDALEFVQADRRELPWVKRCLDVDYDFLVESSDELIKAVLKAIASGDLWLNKIRYDDQGKRVYGNVCLEVYLPHRGTCLLQHVNLGQCTVDSLPKAFKEGMRSLEAMHPKTGVDADGVYLSPAVDKQVGLGLLGLANFLAQEGVTYAELAAVFQGEPYVSPKALRLVYRLQKAISSAASIALEAGFGRAFAIAPTASCSYRSTDLNGYACTPELAPPVSLSIDRDSGTFGVQTYEYPPNVETASEVGWDNYKAVADGIVGLFQDTFLFHGYSFNSWSDLVTYDRDFLQDWLDSPQTSLYYALQVAPDTQAKDDALGILGDDASWFKFDPIDEEDEDQVSGFCSGANGGCSE
jgi:hypothetical protein